MSYKNKVYVILSAANVNIKAVLLHAEQAQKFGSTNTRPLLWRVGHCRALAALALRKICDTHRTEGWFGLGAGLDCGLNPRCRGMK